MKYCYINEDNFPYFKPLLQPDQQIRMMSDPSVCGLGCYDKDRACGIVLYSMDEDETLLRIIYVSVSKSYQGRGIATDMIRSLATNAYEEGTITLANFYATDANDPRYAMFENTEEFTIEELPGGVYEVGSDRLKEVVYQIPMTEYDKETVGQMIPLAKCSGPVKRYVYDVLILRGMEASQLPFIEEDLSYAVFGPEGELTALLTISFYEGQNLYEISYAMSEEPEQIGDLIHILTLALSDVSDGMKSEDTLRFSTPVESVDRLAGKYFSKDFKIENFYLAGYNGDTVG